MGVLSILFSLAIFGFILWLIVTYIPMPDPIRKTVIVVAILVLIAWLLNAVGILGPLNQPINLRRH